MNECEEIQQNNMISNLPLLFANGYPTTLDKMTESQLEKFIPFMVQCSLGHINFQGKDECSEPEWWPENLHFAIPLKKPKKYSGNWIEKLKDVVMICYQFHKSVFLLKFCNDLSLYEHTSLRFINNYNSTTSLFDRRSNKLLVTFRNENMSYDQPQRQRKCLLQQKSKAGLQDNVLQQIMVEPPPFDIYLCDNCDAELYSPEAMMEHEKACKLHDENDTNDSDNDDVIMCDTPEPAINTNNQFENQGAVLGTDNEYDELCERFLVNFNLKPNFRNFVHTKLNDFPSMRSSEPLLHSTACTQQDDAKIIYMETKNRITRRSRTVHTLTRCPSIPLSSPAGQLLLRNSKSFITTEYLNERFDRIERFCYTPILSKTSTKPKYMERRQPTCTPHCSFKKPIEYSNHLYVFPRRQFSQRRRSEGFRLLNSSLLKRCRPISVRLKKMSDDKLCYKQCSSSSKLNIKLTRDNSSGSKWKISSAPNTEIIVDTIDLCTSDDEDVISQMQNDALKCFTTSLQKSTCEINIMNTDKGKERSLLIPLEKTLVTNSLNHSCTNQIFEKDKSGSPIKCNFNSEASCEQINSVKSLFSSVYILSNYGHNPLTAIVSDTTTNNTLNNMCTSNTISPNGSMWFRTVDNDHTYSTNNNKLPNQTTPILVLNSDYKTRNRSTIHPNHILSIDLTS